jgi:1-deoxy-D-xylulose-5-phosphate synthase
MPDRYVTHGKPALLHEEVGFTGRAVARRVAEVLRVDLSDVLAAELSS